MAVGDRLQIADKPTLDNVNTNIGETDDTGGSETTGSVMAKLNNLIDQDSVQSNKLDTVLTLLGSGVAEYTSPGTYQLEIPAGITKIKVTACGGGGGGGYDESSTCACGGGGGGGAAVVNQEYNLSGTSTTQLSITIGSGGAYNKNGGATVIGDLVTLPGGYAGDSGSGYTTVNGGNAGGSGGGAGGSGASRSGAAYDSITVTSTNGTDGIIGTGGKGYSVVVDTSSDRNRNAGCGGGGGGSIGNGGNGAVATGDRNNVRSAGGGTRGSGGGGGAHAYNTSWGNINYTGGKGGNGYAKIEWGL